MAFATPEDVATLIQRDLSAADTATVEYLLDLATAVVQGYTGQKIERASSTVTLKPRSGKVRLPQRPVVSVTSVVGVNGLAVFWEFDGIGTITASSIPIANGPDEPVGLWTKPLRVTYEHGYDPVPSDISAVVTQVAARAFGTPPDRSGLSQEGISTYQYSIGPAAAQGPLGLMAGERAVLDRYRLPASPVFVS